MCSGVFILLLAILPWLVIYSNMSINSDHVWLAECLRRWLAGMSAAQDFYEPNPPWVLLSYVPAHLLTGIMPLHYAVFAAGLFFTALAAAAVYRILRLWPFLEKNEVMAVVFSYAVSLTVMTDTMFGERDHFVAMALMPFVLLQAARTYDLPQPSKPLAAAVFALGAIAILFKPYHGLLPTLMLLDRMRRKKMFFGVLKEPDFLALAAGVIAYAGFLLIFFPDYVSTILPDAMQFYYASDHFAVVSAQAAQFAGIAAALTVLAATVTKPGPNRNFMILMGWAALISLIPYMLQRHGFYYHMLPAISFLLPVTGLLIYTLTQRETGKPTFALLVSALFVSATAYAAIWNPGLKTTHTAYAELPLVKAVQKSCEGKKDCSFFIFDMNAEIPQKISYYAQTRLGSRFPAYWVLPGVLQSETLLANGQPAPLTKEEVRQYHDRFATMTAEDLAKNKPPLLLIGRFEIISGAGIFDFGRWMAQDEDFAREWAKYRKTDTVNAAFTDYFDNTYENKDTVLVYDIYEREQ